MSSSTADPTAEDAQPPAPTDDTSSNPSPAPADDTAQANDTAPGDDTAPAEDTAQGEDIAPAEDTAQGEDIAPAEDTAQADDNAPGDDTAQADDTAPADDAGDPAPGTKPPFSAIAIAALPAGVLPLVPLGLGLGIAGLVTTRRGRRRGRGLALAALLTATGWLAVGAALGTVAYLTHGFHKPTKVEYNDQLGTVFSLRAGDCIINSPNETSPSRTSCSSPHDAEVFATVALPTGPWPGTAAVQQEAAADCSTRLAGYLNPQLAISLAQDYVYPGQVAWQTGTRTVVCEVRATSGQLDQSVRGAAGREAASRSA